MPEGSQYAGISNVPLIKSPSLRVPRPVELPGDIHPLPDDISAYFVYPFTLEPHVIIMESSRRSTLVAHASRREAYLRAREDEKERRKREVLRRIAPGFEPQSAPLVPMRRPLSMGPIGKSPSQAEIGGLGHQRAKSVMEDLVDQLSALETSPSQKPL